MAVDKIFAGVVGPTPMDWLDATDRAEEASAAALRASSLSVFKAGGDVISVTIVL